MKIILRKVIFLLGAISLGLVIFSFGFFIGQDQTGPLNLSSLGTSFESRLSSGEANLFWDVWNALQKKYVIQPINEKKAFYGAIDGMVRSLDDPYSIFLNPDLAKEFKKELDGIFYGIGAEIGKKDGFLVIVAPLPKSPAEKAGLQPGDRLIAINGEDTSDLAVEIAVNKIRGEKGTSVRLTILRSNSESFEVVIERQTIKIPSIFAETKEGNIEYIRISQFAEDSDIQFTKQVNAMLLRNPKGLIIDLRNNPGGFLEPAVDIGSHFIQDQPIVVEAFSDGAKQEYRPKRSADLQTMKVVVLVNSGSASASEILAGALQDTKQATIIGETTFGKGSVQQLLDFDDGSALKITIARWLTPLGREINGRGITPDIEIPLKQTEGGDSTDLQLEKAIEIITQG